jgi:hypothetical protein
VPVDDGSAKRRDLRWTRPEWLAEAYGWITDRLEAHAIVRTGAIEQPHVRWWSTVLRVPTDEGDLFFKAVLPPHTFEPRLTDELCHVARSRVPELVAVDSDRAWMLMRDGGTRLREVIRSPADLAHWERLLPAYAELQILLASRAAELLALGVPDQRIAHLADDLEAVLNEREPLLVGQADGLIDDEVERVRALLPHVRAMAAELTSFGIPNTLQHDDFHDGNVFVGADGYRFCDWGDSCVSHPFHTLVVTLRSIAYRFDLPPGGAELVRIRDAYLEPWLAFGARTELVRGFETAYRTGMIARALACHRFVAARAPPFRAEDASAVPYGLKLFLAAGPIGAWRELAMSRAARSAALRALSTPTHATGTPGGICAIESSASRPSSTLSDDRSGTPMTGRSV